MRFNFYQDCTITYNVLVIGDSIRTVVI